MKLHFLFNIIAGISILQASPLKHRVAYDNGGVIKQSLRLTPQKDVWTIAKEKVAQKSLPKKSPLRTMVFSKTAITVSYSGLKPSAAYKIKLGFLADSERKQKITIGNQVLVPELLLAQGVPVEKEILIPSELYQSGKLTVTIDKISGPNAVLSEASLFSDQESLNPELKVQAIIFPDLIIKGKVYDANNKDKPFEQAKLNISGILTKTNKDGSFSVRVKKTSSDIKILASKGKLSSSITIPASQFEVYQTPRLSPRPSNTPLISLNGTWKFLESVPKDFPKNINALSKKIEVPGEWLMQGFDVKKDTPTAFARTFSVPANMKGQRVKLRFDGVYSDCTVYVNGTKAGGHLGGFTPFELDITKLVQIGKENTLALTVKSESLADTMASGSKYASHSLGGISRKVTLFSLPPVNLESLYVNTDLDENFQNAQLNLEVGISNESEADATPTIIYSLKDPSGKVVELKDESAKKLPVTKGKSSKISSSFFIKNPLKWTCETPNLYTLTIQLSTGHTIVQKVGFKEVTIKGTQYFVNGKLVKLRGVNRHEVDPLRGRSLIGDIWAKDVKIFREANVNLIRTCHYPPAEELLEAADELGMFVEVEGPFCWEAASSDPSHLKATVQQNMEMVIRDRNHPSVLNWSIANESHWGPNFEASSKAMRALDPSRPQIFNTWFTTIQKYTEPFCEIANIHYPGWDAVKTAKTYNKRPVYLGEYIHLNAYNRLELASDRGLRDQWGGYFYKLWEQIYAEPTLIGGSIWSGIDDTFYLKNDITVGYGTWGPIDGWRRRKPEWYHTKKVYSPIRIPNKNLQVQNNEITIPVENRQDFSNLNRLTVKWNLGKQTGSVRADVALKSKGDINIKLASPPKTGEKLHLSFMDPRGFEVDSYILSVGAPTEKRNPTPKHSFKLHKKANVITAQSDGISYNIDAQTGLFTQLHRNSATMNLSGPHLMLLPLNSAGDTQMTGKTLNPKPFTDTCLNWKASSVQIKENSVIVKGAYKEASGQFTYRFNDNGSCSIDYDFTCLQKVNPRQMGVVFDLPAEFKQLNWKRKGLWTTYPEWHIGRLEGSVSSTDGVETTSVGPKTQPDHEWRLDRGPAGSHDFASTKHNIYSASLTNTQGVGFEALAQADRHTRAWIHGKDLRFLIAHFSNGGSERFLRRLSDIDDKPLKKGDKVKSSVNFQLTTKNSQ